MIEFVCFIVGIVFSNLLIDLLSYCDDASSEESNKYSKFAVSVL